MIKETFRKLTDVIFNNILWFFISLFGLLITFGAATTAMFRVSNQILKSKEPTNVLPLFLSSFKENFKESTLVWLILVLFGVPIYVMYHYALSEGITWLLIIAIVASYQWILIFLYIFPTMAIFKTSSIFVLFKNVFLLANANLFVTFKVLGSLAFVLLLMMIHSSLVLIAVGLYGLLVSFHIHKLLKPYLNTFLKEEQEGNE